MKSSSRLVLVSAGVLFLLIGAYMIGARTRTSSSPSAPLLPEMAEGAGRQERMGGGGKGQGSIHKGGQKDICIADECLLDSDVTYPVGILPDTVKLALDRAYTDEYHAHAFYTAVISTLGQSRPFTMIVRSEQMHMASLQALYDKYGISPPAAFDLSTAVPVSLVQACGVAVEAEEANIALYEDELLPVVSVYPDITLVFTQLMNASKDRHLPAFTRCAS